MTDQEERNNSVDREPMGSHTAVEEGNASPPQLPHLVHSTEPVGDEHHDRAPNAPVHHVAGESTKPLAVHEASLAVRILVGLLATAGGVGNAVVVNLGAVFSEYTKDPLRSTFIHFSIATILLTIYCVSKKMWQYIRWDMLRRKQMKWWYVPMPGIIGSSYVAASIALTPQVTYGTFVGFFVFGQVASSLLCDHFAILGTPKNPLTVPRVLVTLGICVAVAVSEGFNPSQGKHSWWATLLMCVTSVVVGLTPPFQALFNKEQSFRYGSPISGACVSFIFGTIWLGLISLLSLAWSPLESNMEDAPWYVWISGIFGCLYVTTTCICPKYLGASLYFVSVVVGQLGTSMIIDATQIFPDNARDVTWLRSVCIIAVVLGVGIKHYLHDKMVHSAMASPASPQAADEEKGGSGASTPPRLEHNGSIVQEVFIFDKIDMEIDIVASPTNEQHK